MEYPERLLFRTVYKKEGRHSVKPSDVVAKARGRTTSESGWTEGGLIESGKFVVQRVAVRVGHGEEEGEGEVGGSRKTRPTDFFK